MGRPSSYTKEIASEVCRRLAEGKTLRAACLDEEMPSESTVRGWVADDREGFSAHYARAREIGYHTMADEILDISDSSSVKDAVDPSTVQRDRLRVDSRKWLLSKALPKIYGEKVEIDTPKDSPIAQAAAVTMAALSALAAKK
jgi:hypothetical protein